jgi:hypothetical protein
MIAVIEPGGRIEGPQVRGRTLPGSLTVMLVRSDGTIEGEGQILIEMDDGERIRLIANALRWIPQEVARELAEGGPYDPAWLYSRTTIRFGAPPAGPYAWLNHSLFIGKSTRMVGGLDATVWRIL